MKQNKKNEFLIFIITVLLITIPIILAFINPSYDTVDTKKIGFWVFSKEKDVITHHEGPFNNAGFASVYAVILYSIVLMRNRSSIFNFGDKKGISMKAIILHCLNLLFLTTLCSLLKPDVKIAFLDMNCNALLFIGIAFSLFGMRSISGFIWIIVAVCLCSTIVAIDGWGKMAWIYVLFSYASLISQIFILKLFKFNKNDFISDFGFVQRNIIEDVRQSSNMTRKVVGRGIDIAKGTVTLISNKNVTNNNNNVDLNSTENNNAK